MRSILPMRNSLRAYFVRVRLLLRVYALVDTRALGVEPSQPVGRRRLCLCLY